jgi:hypothetical protein
VSRRTGACRYEVECAVPAVDEGVGHGCGAPLQQGSM